MLEKPKRRRWLKATRIGLRVAKFFPLPWSPFIEMAELAVDQAEKQLGPKTGMKKKEFTEGFLGDLYKVFDRHGIKPPIGLEDLREIAEDAVGFKHESGQFLREGEGPAPDMEPGVHNVRMIEMRGVTKFIIEEPVDLDG